MKTLILGAVAATLIATPMVASPAAAQHRNDRTVTTVRERANGRTVVTTRTPQYRSWRKGQRFDRRYAQNYQVIDYRRYRGLRAPPRGYHYVRSGNDAVLVGITSGIIASVLTGAIR